MEEKRATLHIAIISNKCCIIILKITFNESIKNKRRL